jgi:HSP20 family protein
LQEASAARPPGGGAPRGTGHADQQAAPKEAETMRYRRLMRQYVAFVATEEALSLGDLLRGPGSPVMVAPTRWRPPVDVCETASAMTVTVELAGVEEDEVEVLLFQDALVVEGQRRPLPCEPGGVYHRAEIRHGPFRLEVRLPSPVDLDVDPQTLDARYDRGLLRISLPKALRG